MAICWAQLGEFIKDMPEEFLGNPVSVYIESTDELIIPRGLSFVGEDGKKLETKRLFRDGQPVLSFGEKMKTYCVIGEKRKLGIDTKQKDQGETK